MSNEQNQGSPNPNTTTGSFASRLLSRALADRKTKSIEINKPLTTGDAAQYATAATEQAQELQSANS